MAPYSLGKVVQILVQAKCITPEYAVKTLTQGDKAERVKPHIPSCTAEML
ncbi:hypothetical protein H6768_00270 [Candidatus Peribacteria bacterium]|nr:hypothetical protein [Candidatus Peribacteria bacterium]